MQEIAEQLKLQLIIKTKAVFLEKVPIYLSFFRTTDRSYSFK